MEILRPEGSEKEKEHTEKSKSKKTVAVDRKHGAGEVKEVSVSTDACSYRHSENRFVGAHTTKCSQDGILHNC